MNLDGDSEGRSDGLPSGWLSCVAAADFLTAPARARRREIDALPTRPDNDEPIRFGFSSRVYGEEEFLAEKGVPINEPQNRSIRELEAPVSQFANSHRNSPPSVEQIRSALPSLRVLFDALELSPDTNVHPDQHHHALAALTEACVTVASSNDLRCEEPAGAFARTVLLRSSHDPDPAHNPEYDAQFDKSPSWVVRPYGSTPHKE